MRNSSMSLSACFHLLGDTAGRCILHLYQRSSLEFPFFEPVFLERLLPDVGLKLQELLGHFFPSLRLWLQPGVVPAHLGVDTFLGPQKLQVLANIGRGHIFALLAQVVFGEPSLHRASSALSCTSLRGWNSSRPEEGYVYTATSFGCQDCISLLDEFSDLSPTTIAFGVPNQSTRSSYFSVCCSTELPFAKGIQLTNAFRCVQSPLRCWHCILYSTQPANRPSAARRRNGQEMQLRPFHPQDRPQHPKISASSLLHHAIRTRLTDGYGSVITSPRGLSMSYQSVSATNPPASSSPTLCTRLGTHGANAKRRSSEPLQARRPSARRDPSPFYWRVAPRTRTPRGLSPRRPPGPLLRRRPTRPSPQGSSRSLPTPPVGLAIRTPHRCPQRRRHVAPASSTRCLQPEYGSRKGFLRSLGRSHVLRHQSLCRCKDLHIGTWKESLAGRRIPSKVSHSGRL